MFKKTINLIVSLLVFSIGMSADVQLSLSDNGVDYVSTEDIYGFQCNHDGCVTGASGGDAAAAGFMISANGSMVFAVSFTGGFIPAGSGALVDINRAISLDSDNFLYYKHYNLKYFKLLRGSI